VHRELDTPAFVLRTRAFGESDRIVTLLTARFGKLTGIAKGAKNSRRRFAGTLEPFVHIRAVFRQRTSSELVFLLRCELLTALRGFTRDLDRFAAGSYVLELTDRLVFARESGPDTYGLVHDALILLDQGASVSPLLRAFELHMLTATGYAPALDRCRSCGAAATEALFLDAERGGLACRRCVTAGRVVKPVSPETMRVLARVAAAPLGEAAAAAPDSIPVEAAAAAEHLIAAVVQGPLRTREFMLRARVDSPGLVR
jgi:DNA repair protein RecO (recombination protein O)